MNNDYITNMWIDSIQNAKKTWIDTWVKDDSMNKPLNAFIEAQRTFTKAAVAQTNEFANSAGEAMAKAIK